MPKTPLQAVKDAMHTLESVPSLIEEEKWDKAYSFVEAAADELYAAQSAIDTKLDELWEEVDAIVCPE